MSDSELGKGCGSWQQSDPQFAWRDPEKQL
jgi:hypothetical protein